MTCICIPAIWRAVEYFLADAGEVVENSYLFTFWMGTSIIIFAIGREFEGELPRLKIFQFYQNYFSLIAQIAISILVYLVDWEVTLDV